MDSTQERFAAELTFCRGKLEGKHQHVELELDYILEGELLIRMEEGAWELKKDDLLVVNSGRPHEWSATEDALVSVVKIDSQILSREAGMEHAVFECNSAVQGETDYGMLRDIMNSLISEYAIHADRINFKKKSLFYELMDSLLNFYLVENRGRAEMIEEDEVLYTALSYIQEHYYRQLCLTEVADRVYMTAPAFSRYFKKRVGINFLKYLNNLRLQRALWDLIYTDKKITDIALEHGYTNLSMFSKAFQAAYHMAPSDYRKQRRASKVVQKDQSAEEAKSLEKYVVRRQQQETGEVYRCHAIWDAAQYVPYRKRWNEVVCVGYAHDLLSARMQQHVRLLRDALGFSYVRIYNIFSWDMQLRRNRQTQELNFELIDNVLDFLVTSKLRPVIDFGDKPRRVLLEAAEALFQDEKPPIFQSREESKWMFTSFVDHIAARYGSDEITQWRFELWKDEQENRGAESYDYWERFDMIAGIVKQRLPEAKVGGYGIELGSKLHSKVFEWGRQEYRPDFLSVFAFPYKRILPGYSLGPEYTTRSTDPHFMARELRKLKRQLAKAGLGDIPVHFSEWNLSSSDRNYYNDSCGKAAQLLMNMVELGDEIETGAYLPASDLSVSYYDSGKMFFGGTGLLSKDGIPKPVYYALYFMQKMGAYRIASGEHYLVTTNGQSSYYILLFHYVRFNYNYFTQKESEVSAAGVKGIFAKALDMEVELELDHVENGNYSVKTYHVGVDTSSALSQWLEMGEEAELSIMDIDYLKRICVPHIKMSRREVGHGQLKLREVLKPHDIRYIHIHKRN